MKTKRVPIWSCVAIAMLLTCAAAAAPPKAAKPAVPPKVDLNTATEAELAELPAIGEAYAKKIIAGRPYKSVKDLSKAGIPPSAVATITKLVAVKAAASSTKAEKPSGKLDLNTATAEQLQKLSGIGEAYAKKIVAGRPYKSVEDLSKAGIPATTIEKIAALVTVRSAIPRRVEGSTTKAGTSGGETPKTMTARTPPRKGMVWVNTQTNVYHKEGSRWYGATTEGKWMTEAEATKDGNHAAKNE